MAMYLKSLTLKGFKSFADTTTLHLEPGITVVVGPNGSGKSNVVDAVAWVLGAQGPRTLRSTKMDDVIFAGAAGRPALGRAEVSLTIDNASGMLPIDFPEVTISRTLFRNGASEYAINQVPCRLLDIQELLSDSGVGRTQHVIVGQGQLDAVLEARPEERRAIIEEAAGVLKFRRRKEKAERRLAATESNLVRLADLVREARRQLRPLERQAEAARRHAGLAGELQALRVHLAGVELSSLATRRSALEQRRRQVGDDERAVRAELARLDTAVGAAQHRLSVTGADDLADPLVRCERLSAQARGLAAILAERRRSIERERDGALDRTVVASLEADAGRLRAELEELDAVAVPLALEAQRLGKSDSALADEGLDLDDGPSDEGMNAATAVREARAGLSAARTAAARGEAELARAAGRLAALEQRAERIVAERDELAGAQDQRRTELAQLDEHVHGAEQAVEVATAELAGAEETWRSSDAEQHRWSARVESLAAALDEARARAGAERLATFDGVLGPLLELVEVDPGWEGAFEAACGQALAAVVVTGGPEGARRCLQHLRRLGSGAVLGVGVDRPPTVAPAVGEAVRAHVRSPHPEMGPLLDGLVGGAVCVGGGEPSPWEQALEVARASPGAVVVTREGDRFAPDGWRVGAVTGGATKAALDDATARAEAAAGVAAAARERRLQAQAALEQARRAAAELDSSAKQVASVLVASEQALARLDRDLLDLARQRAALQRELDHLGADAAGERRRAEALGSTLPELEAAEARCAERQRERSAARARREARRAALAAARADLDLRTAALGERRSWLESRLAEVERRLSGNEARRAGAESRRREVEFRLRTTGRLAAEVAGHTAWLERALADLRERRRRRAELARVIAEQLDTLRSERGAAEARLEALRQHGTRAEMETQELVLRYEAAVEALRRDAEVEPEVAVATPCPPLPEGVTAAGRARELERELRLLGPINPLALEEADALRQRQEFLETQLDDVKASRRELSKVIRAVDAEIVDVFAAAFADVSENFTRLFAVLFPGGEGRLELTEPGDLLSTGIQVRARPAGKNVRSVSLLSGGERSLTALAYLFAVFRSRPSPFYVLDEVEAALDDVNLHRFLDLIDEFRREAQLLVVTHQQRTMEAADLLYGVTMAPGGASGVVSERLTTA
ncbi:MAG: chromosome segregation protein SMC [Actinobacteria bacterium]|nr:chromosome segregation protein SMC [Actinomycetota bacterium]